MSVQIPETRFATVGADRVGYQISGDGPRDLLFTSGLWSHLDVFWEEPSIARFIRQAGQHCRLVRFDRRGSGLSDPRPNDGGSLLDHWSADVQAVLLAAGAVKPMLLCTIDSGPMVLEFIDHHPDTFSALAFVNTTACLQEKPGYPEGHPVAMGHTAHAVRHPLLLGRARNTTALAAGHPGPVRTMRLPEALDASTTTRTLSSLG